MLDIKFEIAVFVGIYMYVNAVVADLADFFLAFGNYLTPCGFEIIETWLTNDARPGREDERWVNILVQK